MAQTVGAGISHKELFHAAQQNDFQTVSDYLQAILQDPKDDNGAPRKPREVVRGLIEQKTRNTLLHYACDNGNVDACKYLLMCDGMADAFLNEPNAFGHTPLFYAASNGRLQLVKWLISNGADIDMDYSDRGDVKPREDDLGIFSPLQIACFKGHEDVVNFLVDANGKLSGDKALPKTAETLRILSEVVELGLNDTVARVFQCTLRLCQIVAVEFVPAMGAEMSRLDGFLERTANAALVKLGDTKQRLRADCVTLLHSLASLQHIGQARLCRILTSQFRQLSESSNVVSSSPLVAAELFNLFATLIRDGFSASSSSNPAIHHPDLPPILNLLLPAFENKHVDIRNAAIEAYIAVYEVTNGGADGRQPLNLQGFLAQVKPAIRETITRKVVQIAKNMPNASVADDAGPEKHGADSARQQPLALDINKLKHLCSDEITKQLTSPLASQRCVGVAQLMQMLCESPRNARFKVRSASRRILTHLKATSPEQVQRFIQDECSPSLQRRIQPLLADEDEEDNNHADHFGAEDTTVVRGSRASHIRRVAALRPPRSVPVEEKSMEVDVFPPPHSAPGRSRRSLHQAEDESNDGDYVVKQRDERDDERRRPSKDAPNQSQQPIWLDQAPRKKSSSSLVHGEPGAIRFDSGDTPELGAAVGGGAANLVKMRRRSSVRSQNNDDGDDSGPSAHARPSHSHLHRVY
ncbi:hypothetical protein P43SY_000082 [Pythium insidiosum]|uniref:TOG domain-containing protein n=1 Tax=Pythium insidiosum TaxID=114742 RepID=A0AAD5QB32_PYTIN|nr:hypothetical protein P43SY_000082 [Pythium insidiosum]